MTCGGSSGTAKSIRDFLVLEALGQEHNHTLFVKAYDDSGRPGFIELPWSCIAYSPSRFPPVLSNSLDRVTLAIDRA